MGDAIRGLISTLVFSLPVLPSTSTAQEAMSFTRAGTGGNCNGCEWIAAAGIIEDGTAERFREFIGGDGFCGIVLLDSPGGSLLEAIELGREFRQHDCRTSVGISVPETQSVYRAERTEPGLCASACAVAFMGGKERYVGPDELGVHQFYLNPETVKALGEVGVEYGIASGQFIQALVLSYLIEMGIDPNLLSAVVGAGPDEMHWLTEEELAQWNVDNLRVHQEPWWIEPYKEGAVAVMQSRYGEQPTDTLTFFCRRDEDDRAYLMLSRDWYQSCREIPLSSVALEFSNGLNSIWQEAEVDRGLGSPTRRFGKSGPSFLSVPLTSEQVEALLSGVTFAVKASLPHVCEFEWGFAASFDEHAGPMARLALRNCI